MLSGLLRKLRGMEYIEIETHGRKEEELADLESGLAALDIEGVIAGAVASVYQADRVKAITDKLGLSLFTPLWHMDTELLLREVADRMDAIIIVTAAEGLDASFLGAHIDRALIDRLKRVASARDASILPERAGSTRVSPSMRRFIRARSRITTSEIRSTS